MNEETIAKHFSPVAECDWPQIDNPNKLPMVKRYAGQAFLPQEVTYVSKGDDDCLATTDVSWLTQLRGAEMKTNTRMFTPCLGFGVKYQSTQALVRLKTFANQATQEGIEEIGMELKDRPIYYLGRVFTEPTERTNRKTGQKEIHVYCVQQILIPLPSGSIPVCTSPVETDLVTYWRVEDAKRWQVWALSYARDEHLLFNPNATWWLLAPRGYETLLRFEGKHSMEKVLEGLPELS